MWNRVQRRERRQGVEDRKEKQISYDPKIEKQRNR